VSEQTPRDDTKTIASWCLYDWANSAFNTLVVTFIYSTFFASAFASDPGRGTALWSRGVVLSAVLIAVLAPVAGALADRGDRRRFLFWCTLTCCGMTALLAAVRPDHPYAAVVALTIFVVANVAFEIGLVFYNAFLPGIVSEERIGRVSGAGWGLGYTGAIVCLLLALPLTLDVPPFGISTDAGFNVRATNVLVAVWFLVFSLPIFYFVRDDHVLSSRVEIRRAFSDVALTVSRLRRYAVMVRFLVARLVYNDGLVTIFAFGGIYARGTFGFEFSEVVVFAIVLNIVAGLGAFVFGFVDDWIGGKKTILISLVFLTVATVIAVFAPNRAWFWVAGVLIGFFLGPNQSASRSLMARFVPAEHESEFFGFFALSGKVTAFMGPLLLGVLSDAYSQRVGVASVVLFFVVGGWLLLGVDEQQGLRMGRDGLAPVPAEISDTPWQP